MTDSLERFLQDLRFDVPAGLVDRAKAAAAVDAAGAVRDKRDLSRAGGAFVRDQPILGRRTELAAAVAAVVLAAILVGTFAYIRAVTSSHTVTPPITPQCPSPRVGSSPTRISNSPAQVGSSPTPLIQSLNVCPGTPVILFFDPANGNQIDGMTWDGHSSGKTAEVPTPASSTCQTTGTTQVCTPPSPSTAPLNSPQSSNPAGTRFVAFPYVYDRSGRVVATLRGGPYSESGVGNYFVGIWADDELHSCQVVPVFAPTSSGVSGTLQLATPGGTARDVAHVGTVSENVANVYAAACSVLADRAVVVEANPLGGAQGRNPINQYWVVQLTTGRVLWTRDLRATQTTTVVASRDGRYVAELGSNGITTIYGPTGSAVGYLTGSVQKFSWDGSLAVVYKLSGCHCSYGGPVSLVRWADGSVIWTGPAGQVLVDSQPEPGGTSLAIATADPPPPHAFFASVFLHVVSSDGKVLGQRVVGNIFPG